MTALLKKDCSACGGQSMWKTPRQKKWLCETCDPPLAHQRKMAGFQTTAQLELVAVHRETPSPPVEKVPSVQISAEPIDLTSEQVHELIALQTAMEDECAAELAYVRRVIRNAQLAVAAGLEVDPGEMTLRGEYE